MRQIVNQSFSHVLNYPSVDALVFTTKNGVRYLREPGIALIGQTDSELYSTRNFLRSYGEGSNFEAYLKDPAALQPATALAKFAGQLCYMSLGEKRTMNADADRYFDNIKAQKHGSVLEHASYTFLFYGIDRAVTHEIVRHRAGTAFSQVSQRYVGPDMLRYVMAIETQGNEALEKAFEEDIETNLRAYQKRIEDFETSMPIREGESKTERRKRIQSFARRALSNEAEAPIVVTANVRAWRHIFTMRLGAAADRAIRRPMFEAYRILRQVCPEGFDDFTEAQLPDGSYSAQPKHDKV